MEEESQLGNVGAKAEQGAKRPERDWVHAKVGRQTERRVRGTRTAVTAGGGRRAKKQPPDKWKARVHRGCKGRGEPGRGKGKRRQKQGNECGNGRCASQDLGCRSVGN